MTEPDTITYTHPETGQVYEIPANRQFGSEGDELPLPFLVDGELFLAVSAVPAEQMSELTGLLANMPRGDGKTEMGPEQSKMVIESVMSMMELFLMDESAERLAGRLRSKERPISVPRLLKIVTTFLNEEYAEPEAGDERPTKPTSESSAG